MGIKHPGGVRTNNDVQNGSTTMIISRVLILGGNLARR